MYLVNFSNQIAAGPKNIANNFIRNALQSGEKFVFIVPNLPEFLTYSETENCKFIVVDVVPGSIKALLNVFKVNFSLMNSLVKQYEPKAILAFGNFLFGIKSNQKKVVLLHHPYIVDDRLYGNLGGVAKIAEKIKRYLFGKTVKAVDTVVVQSSYMQKLLNEKLTIDSEIIFNPISDNFKRESIANFQAKQELPKVKELLYVSRFYAHKNHAFLLKLASEIKEKELPVVINITVDESIAEAAEFIAAIKEQQLPINNLGELPQADLKQYYQDFAFAAIFPSKSETFGNPLIEAMFYDLPVIAPDLDYAHSVLDQAGVIYKEDDVHDCVNQISKLFDLETYNDTRLASHTRAQLFPDSESWFETYMALLR